jgi:hypothetical protein
VVPKTVTVCVCPLGAAFALETSCVCPTFDFPDKTSTKLSASGKFSKTVKTSSTLLTNVSSVPSANQKLHILS